MRKKILALVALGALVMIVGCNPFGSAETKAFITGSIYVDAAMTVPAEGVAVELVVDPDTSVVVSQTVFTNSSGVFFMEVPFQIGIPDDETGGGYTLPNTALVALTAHHGESYYDYTTIQDAFLIAPGDTLVVWPISYDDFQEPGGGSE